MGLRVKATGVGHVVRQSIAPGTKVQRGMRVGLLLSLNDDRHLSENEDLAFRRMYGLPIEKKDSTQKTADSSRTAAVTSENSVVSNSDNKKNKAYSCQPQRNERKEQGTKVRFFIDFKVYRRNLQKLRLEFFLISVQKRQERGLFQ